MEHMFSVEAMICDYYEYQMHLLVKHEVKHKMQKGGG